jgi:hypothetical protein
LPFALVEDLFQLVRIPALDEIRRIDQHEVTADGIEHDVALAPGDLEIVGAAGQLRVFTLDGGCMCSAVAPNELRRSRPPATASARPDQGQIKPVQAHPALPEPRARDHRRIGSAARLRPPPEWSDR